MRVARNTALVVFVTALTALLTWGAVTLADSNTGGETYQVVATPNGPMVLCPDTGCLSKECHGASGGPPARSVAFLERNGGTFRCPVAVCSSTDCHGADPPPNPEDLPVGRY
jgi:hypothetical protein